MKRTINIRLACLAVALLAWGSPHAQTAASRSVAAADTTVTATSGAEAAETSAATEKTSTTIENPIATTENSIAAIEKTGTTLVRPDSAGLELSAPLYAPFVRPLTLWTDFYSCVPTMWDMGWDSWQLHKGFNAQLSLHAITGFGSGAPRGVGFGQDAAFMYALPLTSRLSAAGGLYVSNLDWGGRNYRQMGIAGVATYRVNDVISLYAYGSKTLLPGSVAPYQAPFIDGDRFGGMVNFKFNDTFSMRFSVEHREAPAPRVWQAPRR